MLNIETIKLPSAPKSIKANIQFIADTNIFELSADLVKPDWRKAEAEEEVREHVKVQ